MGLFSKKNSDTNPSANPTTSSSLKIKVTNDGAAYTFLLDGRLDTLTSPGLEGKVGEVIDDAGKLIFDLEKLDYISSAGLRVLLGAAQAMDGKGEMVVRNLSQDVRDIFDLTGFSLMFNIE